MLHSNRKPQPTSLRPSGLIYIFNKLENEYVAAPGLYRWHITYRDVVIRIAELLQSILGMPERKRDMSVSELHCVEIVWNIPSLRWFVCALCTVHVCCSLKPNSHHLLQVASGVVPWCTSWSTWLLSHDQFVMQTVLCFGLHRQCESSYVIIIHDVTVGLPQILTTQWSEDTKSSSYRIIAEIQYHQLDLKI